MSRLECAVCGKWMAYSEDREEWTLRREPHEVARVLVHPACTADVGLKTLAARLAGLLKPGTSVGPQAGRTEGATRDCP